jgi:hypothetical protein
VPAVVSEVTSERPPLPEALLTESATDVDAEDAGEVEYEANLATVGARRGGARTALTSIEVEWRALRQVGLRLEPSYAFVTDGAATRQQPGVSGAVALGLFHDFPRDIHVQAELLGRTVDSANALVFEPGETELPFAADLVSAVRRGRWTLRATVGAEAGGEFAHAPLHTDMAILRPFTDDEGLTSFFGIEIRADWARKAPLVIAPDVVAVMAPLGLPFSLSVALPVNVGASANDPSMGILVRLMWLASREMQESRHRR